MNRRRLMIGAAATAVAACAPTVSRQGPIRPFPIRRSVNLGNALEAEQEGDWGYRIEARHLSAIAEAGFDGVRLPVRWHEHADEDPNYAIAPAFFARVDEVIGRALERGLKVQLDVHHFMPLMDEPRRHARRLADLWGQIAAHYRNAPPELIFEIVNELNGPYWNGWRTTSLYRRAIAAIRASNPERLIVIGPPDWNSIDGLRRWRPPQDENLALTFHFYEPHGLTHHAAEWLGDEAPRFDRVWGAERDIAEVQTSIAEAAELARRRGLPLQLGEFGVNKNVPLEQRALWTRTVREACEANGIAWSVWDFAGSFPIYDVEREAFIPEMRDAVLGQ